MKNIAKHKRKSLEDLKAKHSFKAIKMDTQNTKVKGQMEGTFLKFPHIGEQILESLDAQSLFECRKVSKPWADFINETKALPIKWLQKFTFIPEARLKKSLRKHDVKIVQKLANCAIDEYISMSISKIPSGAGQAKIIYHMIFKKHLHNIQYWLIELMLKNVTDKNFAKDLNLSFNNVLFVAVSNGHFPTCKFITESLKDVKIDNLWVKTLIATANHHGHHDISRLLKNSFQNEKMK